MAALRWLLVLLVSIDSLQTQSLCAEEPKLDFEALSLRSSELTHETVAELEKKVAANPEDIESRTLLLMHYWTPHRNPGLHKRHGDHALWLIENHPDFEVTGLMFALVDHPTNPEQLKHAKSLWNSNVKKFHDNPKVLSNAATFFMSFDHGNAEKLLVEALKIEPDNVTLSEQLAVTYEMHSRALTGEERQELARRAIEQYERVVGKENNPKKRILILLPLAWIAFDTQEFYKAEKYANELLQKNQSMKKHKDSSDAIHYGNIVLGRLALRAGDLKKAKSHLLASAKIDGSPNLSALGPNVILAKELLEKGEKEAVLEYFELCSKWWDDRKLKDWKYTIMLGMKPDFTFNLDHY